MRNVYTSVMVFSNLVLSYSGSQYKRGWDYCGGGGGVNLRTHMGVSSEVRVCMRILSKSYLEEEKAHKKVLRTTPQRP